MNKTISISFAASLFLFQSLCYAQITLSKVFGGNVILQRNIQIPVWGNANPGTMIIPFRTDEWKGITQK